MENNLKWENLMCFGRGEDNFINKIIYFQIKCLQVICKVNQKFFYLYYNVVKCFIKMFVVVLELFFFMLGIKNMYELY